MIPQRSSLQKRASCSSTIAYPQCSNEDDEARLIKCDQIDVQHLRDRKKTHQDASDQEGSGSLVGKPELNLHLSLASSVWGIDPISIP